MTAAGAELHPGWEQPHSQEVWAERWRCREVLRARSSVQSKAKLTATEGMLRG